MTRRWKGVIAGLALCLGLTGAAFGRDWDHRDGRNDGYYQNYRGDGDRDDGYYGRGGRDGYYRNGYYGYRGDGDRDDGYRNNRVRRHRDRDDRRQDRDRDRDR